MPTNCALSASSLTTTTLQYTYETLRDSTPTVLDIWPTRHFPYYLDSSPADGSFCQQDSRNKTSSSAVPVIGLEPENFVMGHMTWPHPYQGQFVVRRLWLAHSSCTSNSNLIETMRLSRTVLEILSFIFQKLKRSRDSDHAPFRDNLSSESWDLPRSTCTCTPNL